MDRIVSPSSLWTGPQIGHSNDAQRSAVARAEAAVAALLRPPVTAQAADDDAAPGRVKLWELEAGIHCSVIGTCLALDDLRRLVRKADASLAPDADDHAVHG